VRRRRAAGRAETPAALHCPILAPPTPGPYPHPPQPQEYHVDGFRFDLASIMAPQPQSYLTHPTPRAPPPPPPQPQEYHVDGFRFDLASIMTRANSAWHPQSQPPDGPPRAPHSPDEESPLGPVLNDDGVMSDGSGASTGAPLSNPPLIEAISEDPILRCAPRGGWRCASEPRPPPCLLRFLLFLAAPEHARSLAPLHVSLTPSPQPLSPALPPPAPFTHTAT
jgi:hypothetical protein